MPERNARSDDAELLDVASGLWIWRIRHPQWKDGMEWQPVVTSVCVESDGEVLLLDPLLPPAGDSEIWTRLNRRPPTVCRRPEARPCSRR